MKKILAVLAVLCMLFACAAVAEETETTNNLEITFRDDVKFGMTMQEVIDADTQTLKELTFGDDQNPHVTFLSTEDMDFNGHTGVTQYLFWDGAMYAVLFNFYDNEIFSELLTNFIAQYGDAEIYDPEGIENWVESVNGNRPAMTGDQYVWSWDNNITLTLAEYDGGCVALYLDAN